jgi:D-sedoheptulose 7-phosphate isomerase
MRTTVDTGRLVTERIRESAAVKQAMSEDSALVDVVRELAKACIDSLKRGGKLLLFGNGGSAADAQHLAAELVGRYLRERSALPAMALNTNSSSVTAIGNDYSYEEIFSRQIEAFGGRADVAIGISTSGNSRNIIRALRIAKDKGMATAAMTGRAGGMLKGIADYCVCVPSDETPRIQEAHILIGHVVCEIIEEQLCQ